MNQEQVLSLVRQQLLFWGGVLVGKGYLTAEELSLVVGAVMALIAVGWALYSRRGLGLVNAAASLPNVRQIVTDPATAIAAPSGKVVGTR